jgi:hypothetical protein
MAKLTISDAARACRIARSTLQCAVQAGRLSLGPDHRVDTAELLRAGYTLHAARQDEDCRTRHAARQDAAPRSSSTRQDAAGADQSDTPLQQQMLAALERENALLRAALDAAAAREEEARANAQAARDERTLLLHMLQEMQHRYDRLLDMPRPAPRETPQDAPGATQARRRPARLPLPQPLPQGLPAAQGRDPRGDMRRRIVALLQEHPEGLTPAEMRTRLGVDKRLADTCLGMRRDGLLRWVERGRYVATEPLRTDHT